MPSDQINIVIGGLTNLTSRTVQKIVLDVVANLKEATPVATGWARANWVPSIGQPYEGSGVNPEKPGSVGVSSQVQQQAGVQTQGEAQIANYKLSQGVCYITNNVPYIKSLDEGHSRKAPAGFVRTSIDKAVTQNSQGSE